jgi:hypothetical protein
MSFWRVRRGPSFLFIGNPALELHKVRRLKPSMICDEKLLLILSMKERG